MPTTHRIVPMTGHDLARRSSEEHATGFSAMGAAEVHSSRDSLGFIRFFVGHRHVGGYLWHGPVADEAAMLSLDNPGIAHACYPGDTCLRSDTGATMMCVANYGGSASDWAIIASAGITSADLTAALAGKASTAYATPDAAGLVRIGSRLSIDPETGLLSADVQTGGAGGLTVSAAPAFPPTQYTRASDGDTNGIIYAIATKFGAKLWSNPGVLSFASAGTVGVMRSSDGSGTALLLTDRQAQDTYSQNIANSWIALDLGTVSLELDLYSIRHRVTNNHPGPPRTWKMQGSNAVSAWSVAGIAAATWVDLDVKVNDTTINYGGQWGSFALGSRSAGYRFFRWIQTGQNAGGNDYLILSEVELYGLATDTAGIAPPGRLNGWLSDGAGHFIPCYIAP